MVNLDILTKTFDDMPVGVGIFHVEDLNDIKSIRYVFMNKIVLYEMRKTKEEVFGKRIIEVAPEAYEHEGGLYVIETYRRIAEEGGSVDLGLVEYSNHMVAGTYHCSIHHIQDNYVYIMLRNVTELEATKNALEEKNKELNDFANHAAHDLKAPIRTIGSFIEILEELHVEQFDDESKELIQYIKRATGRMQVLINDLLEYGKIGADIEQCEIDCNQIVKEIVEDFAAIIKDANASIKVGQLPKIIGYKTEFRLLLQNLINNALKFKQKDVDPVINISVQDGEDWIFSVADNGIGIHDKFHERIFKPFEKLHPSSEYQGSGIGLAHCKKVVELHKGRIWVESETGKGSTFYFSIPKSD